jgi:predicted heme/steroid binding protein
MLKLTRKELKSINGINGKVLIAYKNKIYDVSESQLFKFGLHFNHEAGEDLTEFLKDAPHGEEVLKIFPVVGEVT